MEVLAAGSLFNAGRRRPAVAEADRPDRHPGVQRRQRVRDRRDRDPYGVLTIKAGEADMGLAVGVEQMGKGGLLGAGGKASGARRSTSPRVATTR